MKIFKLSIFIFSLLNLLSCSEETHQPLFIGEVPNAISEYSIENLPGAATVKFKLDDPRTTYVKAVYTVENGLTREAKASKYDNKLLVDGFGQSKEYSVALYAVGKNEQESDPVYITVHPDTPPYQTVLAELDVNADWGGGKITGGNATSAQLMIGVVKKDPNTGEWVDVDVFSQKAKVLVSIFVDKIQSKPSLEFTRDPYQNFSDTLSAIFEPWEEIKLPLTHQNFNQIVMPGDAIGQASYGLRRLFDGLKTSWADGYYSLNEGTFPKVITIDLLKTYQLSRFKYWQNANLYYQSANAKRIRIWGNTTLDPNYDNWHLLGEWDDWRPSKRSATLGNNGLTEEDLAAAQAGNDFDFLLDIPGVRYIRIEALSTGNLGRRYIIRNWNFGEDPLNSIEQ